MAEVLLVDDDANVLLTLAIALRRRGHRVTVAGDPPQALRHLEQRRFDFLISDVRMPGMSGIELAARVRALSGAPRIILTSAHAHIKPRDGLAVAFLPKPIDIEALHKLLSSLPAPSYQNGSLPSGLPVNVPA